MGSKVNGVRVKLTHKSLFLQQLNRQIIAEQKGGEDAK